MLFGMDYSDDILQVIPDEELPQLRDYYKDCYAPYIYSFINTSIKWKAKKPNKKSATYYAPGGDWRSDGTFIAHLQSFSYEFVTFTMEESCQRMYDGFTKTKRFDYFRDRSMFFCIHRVHSQCIHRVIEAMHIPVGAERTCGIWWMSKEKAIKLTVEIPSEVYIRELTQDDVPVANSLWPHRYPGSEKYLGAMLEMGKGYALFLKVDNSITCMIFNQMGTMRILQTVQGHKRKGYASVLAKYLAKEIAKEGYDPVGTVLIENTASQNMFTKLGFKNLDRCYFIECKKAR